MPRPSSAIEVYIEAGSRRAFAGAVAWPGWCRMGREEPEALDALVLYGPRYADVVRGIRPAFRAPMAACALTVVERAVVEGLPESGPRGGKIWLPRYFVRRVAWHALDHAWEIEDRSTS